ncbi:sporulation protein [Desmospora activa]|uniref:Sporulation-control protein n=1 Tax=Desmospora activa DSM 45169 TaxID=1121389 RepID=A0A2T4Z3G5_9BACL|nr:sporulation protein [Desmospora activa]PTM56423.1 sporulation-control protein [Desmospora activa DSM 45169]
MSSFAHLFARVGIGSASVDTRLEKSSYEQGECVRGEVVISGGKVAQEIEGIDLYLIVTERTEEGTKHHQWAKFRLTEPLQIESGEIKNIPFTFQMPLDTPVSGGAFRTYLQTGLDVDSAVDPQDRDHIEVRFHRKNLAVYHALLHLGFREVKDDGEEAWKYGINRRLRVQEIEFRPGQQFRGTLDELEMTFTEEDGKPVALLLVDRRARNLMGIIEEQLGVDDRLIRFAVKEEEAVQAENPPTSLTQRLWEKIREQTG